MTLISEMLTSPMLIFLTQTYLAQTWLAPNYWMLNSGIPILKIHIRRTKKSVIVGEDD
jgi:hypothetical protein